MIFYGETWRAYPDRSETSDSQEKILSLIYVEISWSVRQEELISVNRSHHIIRSDGLREVKPWRVETEAEVGESLSPVALDTRQGGEVTRETVHD